MECGMDGPPMRESNCVCASLSLTFSLLMECVKGIPPLRFITTHYCRGRTMRVAEEIRRWPSSFSSVGWCSKFRNKPNSNFLFNGVSANSLKKVWPKSYWRD